MRITVCFVLWLLPLNLCHGWTTVVAFQYQQKNSLKWMSPASKSSQRRGHQLLSSMANAGPEDDNENQIGHNEQTIQGASGEEEEECFDLCDIDWDLLPQWSEDETATSSPGQQQQQSDTSAYLDESLEEEDDEDDEEDEIVKTATKNRLRLEMQWQLWKNEEDCDVTHDVSSCGSYCKECDGRGWQLCRFCHGKGMVVMGSSAMECLICSRAQKNRDLVGTEMCRSCRGTGWVAPWTTLASKL